MQFHYKAVKSSGEPYERTVEAADKFALYQEVRKEGGTVVSLEEDSGALKHYLTELANRSMGRVKTHDVITFARSLGAMISSGLPLSRSLAGLERQTKSRALKKVIAGVARSVEQGSTFADALVSFPHAFPKLFVSMVRAGEESGNLAGALSALAHQMEQSYTLKKKIRGAMTYPVIVLIAMALVATVMFVYVVPTLSGTFIELGVSLPASTRLLVAIGDFVSTHTLAGFGIVATVIVAFVLGVRTARGKRCLDFLLLHTPLIASLVKETNAARTARTLSSLLTAGVEIVAALAITRDVVQNSYFREVLVRAEKNIETGATLTAVFSTAEHLYPPLFSEMVAVGEESGKLSEMLVSVADFYEDGVAERTKNMSTIVEPLLMVVIGAAVGFFAISMISPIYSISSSI